MPSPSQSPTERRAAAVQAETNRLAAIRRCFAGDDGVVIMAWLENVCNYHVPVFIPGASSDTTAFRDGRRSILLEIKAALRTRQDADSNPPKTITATKKK